eukprot:scaffold21987_cov44-Phaeocystis_antarctica.AAC.1
MPPTGACVGGRSLGFQRGRGTMSAARRHGRGCLTGRCAPQSGSEPAASLGWVNRDVRPLAAPLRPSPASQQRRRASMERSISAKRSDPLINAVKDTLRIVTFSGQIGTLKGNS